MSDHENFLTRRELLLGGAAFGGAALAGTPSLLFAADTAQAAAAGGDPLVDLRNMLRGELIAPGDAGRWA